jgi:hypothetical protein
MNIQKATQVMAARERGQRRLRSIRLVQLPPVATADADAAKERWHEQRIQSQLAGLSPPPDLSWGMGSKRATHIRRRHDDNEQVAPSAVPELQ